MHIVKNQNNIFLENISWNQYYLCIQWKSNWFLKIIVD